MKYAVLVYQAGIANVFEVECLNMSAFGRDAKRLEQSDFKTCEAFARGLRAAGVYVQSAHCNEAGDIVDSRWSEDLDDAPFSDKFSPVRSDRFTIIPNDSNCAAFEVNTAQRKALQRKFEHNADGAANFEEFQSRARDCGDYIMLPWCGMWLGIEADGYTHS